MKKTPPTPLQIVMMGAFALSCFAIALFLWMSFGGPTPLSPRGYEVKVPFDEATQLVSQSDVRISGVSVGTVSDVDLPVGGGRLLATLEIDPEFSPLPADVRATLREKTLLGEAYVELTPGDRNGPTLGEGETLPVGQVADPVQLDQILRVLDPETRAAFQTWMQDSAVAVEGRGESLSGAFGILPSFFEGFERLFRVLDSQEQAVRHLFSRGAETWGALSRQQGELRGLIQAWNEVSTTTAARDQSIVEMFRVFPTFLDESRLTLARMREFAVDTDPLVRQLVPAAHELSPTLEEIGVLAPELDGFFDGLVPVIDAAPDSFPALRELFRDDFPPTLRALDPFLRQFNPLLDNIRANRRELAALLGSASAATNPELTNVFTPRGLRTVKYLRAMTTLTPESFATYSRRLDSSRANAYNRPGAYAAIAQNALESFETRQCGSGAVGALDPATPLSPLFQSRVETSTRTGQSVEEAAVDFFDRIQHYSFGDLLSSAGLPAPPCIQQAPFGPFGSPGNATTYPHTLRQEP
jgi:phospholipid/cholesterol/gamma-HCH transport system substrate-binding protein